MLMMSEMCEHTAGANVVVMFLSIGSYHAARLRAADAACRDRGWTLSAIQITDHQSSHPWGDLGQEMSFSCRTLMPGSTTGAELCNGPYALQAATRLKSCLAELRPSVVFVPGWGCPVSRAAIRWCRQAGVSMVLMSESKQDDRERVWWKEWLKAVLYVRPARAALAGGGLQVAYLGKLGIPADRIFLGYDVVDNDYFRTGAGVARNDPNAARGRCPMIPGRPFFLSLTRFLPRKNVVALIDAYAEYRSRVGSESAWELVICGHGSEEPSMRASVGLHGLQEHVYMPGFVQYDALGDWYGLASAFVHPALEEAWGLVVNEACAAGLPILCSRTVGSRYELVQDGQNGFLFDPSNVEDIADALLKVSDLSEPMRAAMGVASQNIVSGFGPDRFSSGFVSAVSAAVGSTAEAHPRR